LNYEEYKQRKKETAEAENTAEDTEEEARDPYEEQYYNRLKNYEERDEHEGSGMEKPEFKETVRAVIESKNPMLFLITAMVAYYFVVFFLHVVNILPKIAEIILFAIPIVILLLVMAYRNRKS